MGRERGDMSGGGGGGGGKRAQKGGYLIEYSEP